MEELGRLTVRRREGTESFHDQDHGLGFTLLDFWQWSSSDVVSNAARGILAEYLVATAVGAAGGVREEWAAYDLQDPRGTRIEVKSAAYIQSWHQKRLSVISFGCSKTLAWDAETSEQEVERRRQADVYVFALLAHRHKTSIDPLDVSQWEFYVVPTHKLDERTRSQHSITLASLRRELRIEPVGYYALNEAINTAAELEKAKTRP